MSTTTINDACIDSCNSLLRGELAATETYRQAYEKFAGQPQADTLQRLHATHQNHVSIIRDHILSMGGEPSTDSGAWGSFAQAVEGAAKLFGETASLQALIAGEKHGISSYEAALENEHVHSSIKTVYSSEVIPALHQNVAQLERLQESV